MDRKAKINVGKLTSDLSFLAPQPLFSASITRTHNAHLFNTRRVDSDLNAIKGGGACQLREKVLAEAAETWVMVADYRKNGTVLGENVSRRYEFAFRCRKEKRERRKGADPFRPHVSHPNSIVDPRHPDRSSPLCLRQGHVRPLPPRLARQIRPFGLGRQDPDFEDGESQGWTGR